MGGSALYMANLCDIINHGHILTIDINQVPTAPIHPRISYLIGSSISENVLNVVSGFIGSVRKVMVILDSDHTKQHVLDELNIYSRLVSPQQYLIVEDSNIHGHPTREDLPAGPFEAINEFYKSDPISASYIQDKMCERFLMTFNPNGYLRRIK
jgi:cephalosporin hydroxylase